MKVKYQFVNEMVEIEIDNDWSAVITELDRKERNNNKTETRRHCSFDAFDMETSFGSDTDASMEFLKKAEFKNVYATLEKLSERHRHLLTAVYMDGVSLTELAIQEGCTVAAIHYALSTARKKFKKIYQENLKKT